ncbi:MAG: 2-polyprenylphenol hydroxylase [Myxococcaceae bacterium]|nr:2-polyprenylphenol hydroxylase [Myxococcaceae bacterium]
MSQPEALVRIAAVRALSPSVRSLSLEPVQPAVAGASLPLAFAAGQWLNLHVPTAQGGTEKRAYSIASGPLVRPLELAVTYVADGVVSPVLHALSEGAELLCDGPYGFFTRDGELRDQPALFVGTGTGLSPLRSMLTELLAEPQHPPVTLLFGVRTQADILWREELESWARRDPRFSLEVTLSRPDESWSGRSGHVQNHVAALARALGEPHVFVCGLSPMVSEVRALCKTELRYDRKRIHSERYD